MQPFLQAVRIIVSIVCISNTGVYAQFPNPQGNKAASLSLLPLEMQTSVNAASLIPPETTAPIRENQLQQTTFNSDPPTLPHFWHPNAPPANYTSSNCDFNIWCSDNIFSPDYRSCQFLLGAYFTARIGPDIKEVNYIPVTVRQGWMLNAPQDTNAFWRGNWEFLCDFTAAGIISGFGHAFAGPSFYFRYNFVQPDASIVPYFQLGTGFVINDAYKDRTQRAIGQAFEFYLHVETGFHYFIEKNLSLDFEWGLQHISNANLASRNLGVNALGAQLGFTYYFPSGGR